MAAVVFTFYSQCILQMYLYITVRRDFSKCKSKAICIQHKSMWPTGMLLYLQPGTAIGAESDSDTVKLVWSDHKSGWSFRTGGRWSQANRHDRERLCR